MKRFLRDQRGGAAGEYALILAVFGVGLVAAGGELGAAISEGMGRVAAALDTNGQGGSDPSADGGSDGGGPPDSNPGNGPPGDTPGQGPRGMLAGRS
ncbi:MAG: Flp family type IVb pilin [Phenylobacterium sp.]|uniref:Flp family type IVb pilin n=1 Tax=Phenylobacterium sp. TaxID=1871053 RepID=UPI00391CB67D